jgi:hypothetical protein
MTYANVNPQQRVQHPPAKAQRRNMATAPSNRLEMLCLLRLLHFLPRGVAASIVRNPLKNNRCFGVAVEAGIPRPQAELGKR